jgi:tRNA nucleotidyltransferase (CCA-adding enzyme)
MVGKGAMQSAAQPTEDLAERLRAAHPELAAIEAAASAPVYVVGGAVRDLLLGRGRADLDLVVEGDAAALAAALGAEPVEHERFATAKAVVDGHDLDLASARTETYAHPGALPDVTPAASIEDDLGRRDFTINAMAIPLADGGRLIDPLGGRADLEAGVLRVLHRVSFADDPTRAIRAARYAARLGFAPETGTAALLRAADLGTVSADRRQAELLRLAAEESGPGGLALLAEWGLLEPREGGLELAASVGELLEHPPWASFVDRPRTVLAAALGGPAERSRPGALAELAAARSARPSEAVALASGRDPSELAIARALGAEWLDTYVAHWRLVELEIGGEDLLAAGVAPGPAIGRGLAAALRDKLDGRVSGREQELAAALAAARTESA